MIKAYKEKLQRDLETWRKMETMDCLIPEEHLKEFKELEDSKTDAFMIIEYGYDLSDI